MPHGSGVIVQVAEPDPDPVTMTSSVIPWAGSHRGADRGQSVCRRPRRAPRERAPRHGSYCSPIFKGLPFETRVLVKVSSTHIDVYIFCVVYCT